MRNLILVSGLLLAAGGLAGPAAAKQKCDAKYYNHLVGRDVSEAQKITNADYRLVPIGSTARATSGEGRMTIRYDKDSGRIVEVSCG